jgi:hypothetical protein
MRRLDFGENVDGLGPHSPNQQTRDLDAFASYRNALATSWAQAARDLGAK